MFRRGILPKNQGIKLSISREKAVEGWRGLLAISNQPRQRSESGVVRRMGWLWKPRHIQSTKRRKKILFSQSFYYTRGNY